MASRKGHGFVDLCLSDTMEDKEHHDELELEAWV